jgi:hypothetical protein
MLVRALEKITIRQHGKRRGAATLVLPGDDVGLEILPQQPSAGRRTLYFGDDGSVTSVYTGPQGIRKWPRWRHALDSLTELTHADAFAARGNFLGFARKDLLEDIRSIRRHGAAA